MTPDILREIITNQSLSTEIRREAWRDLIAACAIEEITKTLQDLKILESIALELSDTTGDTPFDYVVISFIGSKTEVKGREFCHDNEL